jgi:hypothetical protein
MMVITFVNRGRPGMLVSAYFAGCFAVTSNANANDSYLDPGEGVAVKDYFGGSLLSTQKRKSQKTP